MKFDLQIIKILCYGHPTWRSYRAHQELVYHLSKTSNFFIRKNSIQVKDVQRFPWSHDENLT